jgi:hypothetical protein
MWMLGPTRHAIVLVSLLTSLPLLSWAQTQTLKLEQILSRMDQVRVAERGNSVAYTVTREYQLGSEGAQQPTSYVVAQVNFVPPAAKDYNIVKAEGSDRGTSIVRKVLEHETSMTSHSDSHELTSANYDFALLGRETIDGRDCYVLQLSPKREAVELVRGKAWVDANDFEIRRIDGQTAKNPSFWIKKLNVTINYGQVNGVWVQTNTKAVADVRVAGPHVLTSRELDVQTATFSAREQAPAKARSQQRSNSRRTVADTAAWVAR